MNLSGEFMQLRTILIFSVLICSSLAGCVEEVREEKDVEKEDLRKIDDKVISTDDELKLEDDLDEIKITKNTCEDLRGIWIEDREHCHFEDEERNETSESNMTQEDCEESGGTWTEDEDRDGAYYCHSEDEEREEEQEV